MTFLKDQHDIIQCVGEVLKRAYGDDYDSVLPMFANTDCPMPEVFTELTEEQNKQLEDRFLYCITEAALADTFEELKEFLEQTVEKLRASYINLRTAGYKWLVDFTCNDKKSFLNFGVYLIHATIFRKDADKFYLKFTNTRKHSKKRYDVNGAPIYHSLYHYSPVASTEYVPDLFTIEDYGEKYIVVANLYKEIIYVLGETYKFVMSIDQMAVIRKSYSAQCLKSLHALVEDTLNKFRQVHPNLSVPTTEQVEEAKRILPSEITKKVFSLDISELSTTLYHEVLTQYGYQFGLLVNDRLTQSQGLMDVEYLHVFKHIKDSQERYKKAVEARCLLSHIEEFMQLNVKKGCKSVTERVTKGKIACLFYKWTGTTMSQKAFLRDYYCVQCTNQDYHVAQNSLSVVNSKIAKDWPLFNDFNVKADEIIKKYKVSNTPMIPLEQNYALNENNHKYSVAH